MRFHVVSLPHTQTTKSFSSCAYTEKVRKFCNMMKARGHTVFLYAGEQNEAQCDELIPCITEAERTAVVGDKPYVYAATDQNLPHWRNFNAKVFAGIDARAQTRDIICVSFGRCHESIAKACPGLLTVEIGVGYSGTFSPYRVWESYAWMHACYGAAAGDAANADGRWYETVIPNFFEPADFPFSAEKDNYFLFIGRLIERKGVRVATQACKLENAPLILAGYGDKQDYGTHIGVVTPEQRGILMSRARAVFVPTEYVEPFGGVAVEAMMCGTPVITTDWGAFTETVVQGVTGYRCRLLREFRQAMHDVEKLNPAEIRKYALSRYAPEAVAPQYEAYFERLDTLWGAGWNAA